MNGRAGSRRLAAACCLALLAWGGCKKKSEPAAPPPEAAKPKTAALPKLGKSRQVEHAPSKGYLGEVVAKRTVRVAAKVRGRVLRMRKEIGDKVRRGELLTVLDGVDTARQLDEARAAVLTAKAQVVQAQAQLARAQRELRRKRPLYQKDLVTKQDMDNVVSAVELARAGLGLAKARVAQAQTRVKTLKTTLDHTRIRAPFAGRVSARLVEPGAIVTDMNPTPIYEIVTAHKLLVRFKVPERDLRGFPEKKVVHLRVAAYPGKPFAARLVRIYPEVDKASRAAVIEARIEDPKHKLRAGMFARVEVTWPAEKKVVVPRRALVQENGRTGVYVKGETGARFVRVDRGVRVGDDVEVVGLKAGVPVYLGKPPAAVLTTGTSPKKKASPPKKAARPPAGPGSRPAGRREASR